MTYSRVRSYVSIY